MTSLKQARAGAIVLAIAACALAGCTRSIVTVPDQGQGAQQIPQGDTPGMIYTIIGNGGIGNGDFKPALEATQYYPMAPFFDEQTKTLYYIDWNNHQIKILSSDGRVESIVDRKGVLGDTHEGLALDVEMNHPTMITRHDSDLVIAAWHNHRIKVIHPNGYLNTIAGSSVVFGGFTGDNGPAALAQFTLPSSVAFDDSGNAYVSDTGNFRIRKIFPDAQRTIVTFAGFFAKPAFGGDGMDALDPAVRFAVPTGADAVPCFRLAIDRQWKRLYIADTWNNRIRMIDLDHGTPDNPNPTYHYIYTFAGSGSSHSASGPGGGYSGDGGPPDQALLKFPTDVAIGPDHSVYICDSYNSAVRRVRPVDGTKTGAWVVSTVAGNGLRGFSGDGGSAISASLDHPNGVYVSQDGHLYIADTENQRVRRVKLTN